MDRATIEKRLNDLRLGSAGLKARIEQLTAELEQRKADLHATAGAIQENQHWLEQFPAEAPDTANVVALVGTGEKS